MAIRTTAHNTFSVDTESLPTRGITAEEYRKLGGVPLVEFTRSAHYDDNGYASVESVDIDSDEYLERGLDPELAQGEDNIFPENAYDTIEDSFAGDSGQNPISDGR